MTMGTMPRACVSSALMEDVYPVSRCWMGLWRPLCRVARNPTVGRWRLFPALQAGPGSGNARLGRAFEAEPWTDQAVISESNGSSLSVTLALDSTNSVTLFSTTMASTSAMRERSDRYQRCTSTGFS